MDIGIQRLQLQRELDANKARCEEIVRILSQQSSAEQSPTAQLYDQESQYVHHEQSIGLSRTKSASGHMASMPMMVSTHDPLHRSIQTRD